MPSFKHSKLSKFLLGILEASDTPALLDISAWLDDVSDGEDLDLVDVTTFQSTSKQYIAGFADGKVSIAGNWDTTIHGYLGDLKDAFRDGTLASTPFQYGPQGNTVGDARKTGNLVMTNYEIMSAIKDQVKFKAEFQITGPTNDDTF